MQWFIHYWLSIFFAVLSFMSEVVKAQSTTVRPYQFGFSIDQQQHRYEKRDERGIVMGEFGFITADGIYHVTVYATDEEGKFRILAMKSYPYESPPKTVEMIVQPKAKPTITTTTTSKPKFNHGLDACGGCSIPNGNGKPNGLDVKMKVAVQSQTKSLSTKPLQPPYSAGSSPSLVGSGSVSKSGKISRNHVILSEEINEFRKSGNNTKYNLDSYLTQEKLETQKPTTNRLVTDHKQDKMMNITIRQDEDEVQASNIAFEVIRSKSEDSGDVYSNNFTKTSTKLISENIPFTTRNKTILIEHNHEHNLNLSTTLSSNSVTTSPTTLSNSYRPTSAIATSAQKTVEFNERHHSMTTLTPEIFESNNKTHDYTTIATKFTNQTLEKNLNVGATSLVILNATDRNTMTTNEMVDGDTPVKFMNNFKYEISGNQRHEDITKQDSHLTQAPPTTLTTKIYTNSEIYNKHEINPVTHKTETTPTLKIPQIRNHDVIIVTTTTLLPATISKQTQTPQPPAFKEQYESTNEIKNTNLPQIIASLNGKSAPALSTAIANGPLMDIIIGKVLPAIMGNNGKAQTKSNTAQKGKSVPTGSVGGGGGGGGGGNGNNALTSGGKNKKAPSFSSNTKTLMGDGDLYRFTYLLDYNGHTETGKRNGNKVGNYFAIGDDDIERTIEYVADENGFQPRIRWRKLDANTIKAKSKMNSLKDYEFIWFKNV